MTYHGRMIVYRASLGDVVLPLWQPIALRPA